MRILQFRHQNIPLAKLRPASCTLPVIKRWPVHILHNKTVNYLTAA